MEDIKKLQAEQIDAYRAGDFARLNAINKEIFRIREQRRKERAKAREQERDNQTNEKIIEILKGD